MTYYLFLPEESQTRTSDYNTLGEASFKNFWTGGAWPRLLAYYDKLSDDLVEGLVVRDSKGGTLTVNEFFDQIKSLTIIQN